MSSPSPPADAACPGPFPFDSYAKLARILIPSVTTVGFYDPHCRALWLSDDVDEPELRMGVELVMERIDGPDEPPRLPGEANFRVLPIRDATQVYGALVLVLDRSRVSAGYRRSGAVERLLGPLLTRRWRTLGPWRRPPPYGA